MTLSGIMPLFLGATCLLANDKALGILKMTHSPDVYQLSVVFGICLLGITAVYALAIAWLVKSKPEGFTLSKIVGVVVIVSGLLMILVINRTDFGGPDLVKGMLILIVAYWAERNTPKSEVQ